MNSPSFPACEFCRLYLDYEVNSEALMEAEESYYALKRDYAELRSYVAKLELLLKDNGILFPGMNE